jgi:hypothetical protein
VKYLKKAESYLDQKFELNVVTQLKFIGQGRITIISSVDVRNSVWRAVLRGDNLVMVVGFII